MILFNKIGDMIFENFYGIHSKFNFLSEQCLKVR